MKKLLIITYYWPPGGGAGVQRWLKFVKYLPGLGWQPVIYTPENGEMPVTDASLEKDIPPSAEILRTPIWEPYSIYKRFVGVGKDEKINTGFLTEKKKPGLAENFSVWLRGNLFIPDARCYWVKPSVKYLSAYLRDNKVDAIVSTGPPHSMHLIALQLSGKFNIPWLADFRDPWTNIDYYKDLMLTTLADRKHHKLEREVVTGASRVVVVGKTMKQEFERDFKRKVDVITNGYDADDVKTTGENKFLSHDAGIDKKFIIAHVGTLVRSRNPITLWKAIATMVNTDADFEKRLQIRLTGKVDIAVRTKLKELGLERFVTYIEYLPHDEVISEQQQASVLLLVLNHTPNAKGILTGKLFEYLAAKRPIICVGPVDGDAAAIITETGSGVVCDFEDDKAMETALKNYFSSFSSGIQAISSHGIEEYSRQALTEKMVAILEEMKSGNGK